MRLTIAAGLAGAFLLARGRAYGLALMESTHEGAWRSFVAAFVCLPAFLALRFFAWAGMGVPEGGFGRSLLAELLGYATAWVTFALLSLPIVDAWGRSAAWPRFIAAWNWTNVVQYLVLLALSVPALLGLPPMLAQALALVALGYALWLEWFVTRAALEVDGGRAVFLVLVDSVLGLLLAGVIRAMSGG